MKLDKRERKFIVPAVYFDWKIEESLTGDFFWDYDRSIPVKIDSTCKRLIKKGILEELFCGDLLTIKSTELGKLFKCDNAMCHNGWLYDNAGEILERCTRCDGIGIMSESAVIV